MFQEEKKITTTTEKLVHCVAWWAGKQIALTVHLFCLDIESPPVLMLSIAYVFFFLSCADKGMFPKAGWSIKYAPVTVNANILCLIIASSN